VETVRFNLETASSVKYIGTSVFIVLFVSYTEYHIWYSRYTFDVIWKLRFDLILSKEIVRLAPNFEGHLTREIMSFEKILPRHSILRHCSIMGIDFSELYWIRIFPSIVAVIDTNLFCKNTNSYRANCHKCH